MNNGVKLLAVLLAITIGGGVLTADLAFSIPIIQQTTDPQASVFMATNGQAFWFLILVGAVLFNVIGAGVTLAIVFWLLNWQVNEAYETPTLAELREQEVESPALPEEKAKQLA